MPIHGLGRRTILQHATEHKGTEQRQIFNNTLRVPHLFLAFVERSVGLNRRTVLAFSRSESFHAVLDVSPGVMVMSVAMGPRRTA